MARGYAEIQRMIQEYTRRVYGPDAKATSAIPMGKGEWHFYVKYPGGRPFLVKLPHTTLTRKVDNDPPRRSRSSHPTFAERLYETRKAREHVNADFLPLFNHLISLAEHAHGRGRPQEAGRLLAKARALTKHGTTPRFTEDYGNFPRRRGIDIFSKRVTSQASRRDRRRRARRSRRR